jgi:hypothetical protein
MKKKPKVTAYLEKSRTTIDNATGNVLTERAGVLKGFGKGFQDYLKWSIVQVDIETNTGQFPDTHVHAGKWAVQILLSPCDTQEQANVLADKLTPIVRNALGHSVPTPLPMKRQ